MIKTFSTFGYEGSLVTVEVDLRREIPAVDIVGLSDGCVKETRERIICAIKNQNLQFPTERVLISLSPADLKKNGASFDLPTALAILEAQYGLDIADDVFCMGELELSGAIRSVKGINAGLQTAHHNGIEYAIIPVVDNLSVPKGMKVRMVETLTDAYYALCDMARGDYSEFVDSVTDERTGTGVEFEPLPTENLDTIKGHNGLKYAMAVAVAGRHSILAWGSTGSGKTLVMQHMSELMPKLLDSEKDSVKRIYSLTGMDGLYDGTRPFRMPHQTASIEGMCGGGSNCRAGEISLAHNGVLLLDEASEFRSSVLQMLRVPLESNQITLSRAGRTTVFPAKFQLAMTMLPCPCGNFGNKDKVCLCSAKAIEAYWKKISAPLLDRIAIRFNCNTEHKSKELTDGASVLKDWTVEELRNMIKRAWEAQYARQDGLNQDMIIDLTMSSDEEHMIAQLLPAELTPREKANITKVSRTIADMNGHTDIDESDVKVAIELFGKLPLDF